MFLVVAGIADAAGKRLVQLRPANGCIVSASVKGCLTQALGSPADVVLAGRQAYVSDLANNRILIYNRNVRTGALTPRPIGIDGCISDGGTGGCASARAFQTPGQMVVSRDGRTIYVLTQGSNGVAVLTRDTATGTLRQSAILNSCVTQTGSTGQCVTDAALTGPMGLALSPNGQSLYVTGEGATSQDGFLAVLDVDLGGLLIPHAAASGGCAQNQATVTGCQDARALAGGRQVAVSPDSKNVYVTATNSDAIVTFTRNADGGVSTVAGPDGCLESPASPNEGCRTTPLIGAQVFAITFASDTRMYVSGVQSGSVTLIQRAPSTGGLSAPGSCVGGADPSCSSHTINLFGAVRVRVSHSTLVVGARFGRGVWLFKIARNGTLIVPRSRTACLATGGSRTTSPCQIPRGFAHAFAHEFGPGGLALSPDAKFVYAVSPQDAEDQAGIVTARIVTPRR